MAIDEQAVVGRWVHSHEEDTDTEMVFRPASRKLPLSRGRRALELIADGTAIDTGIGPADVPHDQAGRWDLHADGALVLKGADGHETRLRLIAAEPDRLVFARTT